MRASQEQYEAILERRKARNELLAQEQHNAMVRSNREALAKGPVKARKASDNKAALGEGKKPKKPNRKEESNMQKRCVTWFRLQYKQGLLFSVPNGSHLAGAPAQRAIQTNALKAEGMLPGVSDLLLFAHRSVYFLEAKAKDGVQRKNQEEFEAYVRGNGYEYHIFRSLDEFQEIVNKIIKE